MSDISPHFKRSEFACQCGCGFDTVDAETLRILEVVRQHYIAPVTITSGCRCDEHNAKIGGAKNSKHVEGRAVDFKVAGHSAAEVYDFIDNLLPDRVGLGLYSSWVHLDTRTDGPARWSK